MAERGGAAGPAASREDSETLQEIARQMSAGERPDDAAGGKEAFSGEAAAQDDAPALSFESAATGLALCSGGEITRANASFALAFGYPTPGALMKAGGLAAIFPEGALAPTAMAKPGEASREGVFQALTRSRRLVRTPIAAHDIAGEDGEPVTLLVLHPDAAPAGIVEIDLASSTRGSETVAQTRAPQSEAPSATEDAAAPRSSARHERNAPAKLPEKRPAKTRKRRNSGETAFLAKVSHDMRIPLNSIIGFAQLMKDEQLGPLGCERYRGYVRDIVESGEFALGLINDLLDISKVETGAYELNFTSVDANALAGECLQAVQPLAHKERVFLRMALDDALPLVLADRPSLKQILLNLLRNAVTFTNPGGQVILESRRKPSGAVRLGVLDSGVGMSESEIAQAMQPFLQRDTAPRMHSGTGLALPLTKALAKANRAKFRLASSAAGGTRISVTFPAGRTLES